MFKLVFLLMLAVYGYSIDAARTVNGHLGANDIARFQKVFADGLGSNDLQSIYYASLNIQSTKTSDKEELCKNIVELHKESKLNNFEKDYYLIGANKQMGCAQKLSPNLLNEVYASLKETLGSAQEIYYRVATHKLLGVEIDEASVAKIVKTLQDILKKDDTLVSMGYAFNVAPHLGMTAAFVAERVEDAIVQADEVDGRLLQFEGGLSITALIINGVFKVNKSFNKPTSITKEQAVKFANYFLSRRSVQTAKGAHVLIESLKTLTTAADIAPSCIQILGNGQLPDESPSLSIAIVDLFGKALKPAPQNVYGKVQLKPDNSVLAEKIQFTSKSSDKTIFVADLSTLKPKRGIYTVDVTADNIYTQKLKFKVLGRVKVQSLEIGVVDSDAISAAKKQNLVYPNTLKETLTADITQKLVLKSVLVDESTSKALTVHQAFVRFYNKETGQEIIFVAEQDSSKTYKFDVDVGAHSNDFAHKSGSYEMYLIVGDASLSNSFEWHVANVQLKFSQEPKDVKKLAHRSILPEIVHQFRAPDKRPPRIVSDIFTGLCITPLVLLFIFWGKLGINISNFTAAPSTMGFHLGFGGILALFAIFWLKLNMFQTLRLLIPIAVFTFLCGNRLLRRIYSQRVGNVKSSTSS